MSHGHGPAVVGAGLGGLRSEVATVATMADI